MFSFLLLVKLSVWTALLDGGPCISRLALRPALYTQDECRKHLAYLYFEPIS